MLPYLTDLYGNPSSIHGPGREARRAIDNARDAVASALHCDYSEITFTSGGTEADNLAIFGVCRSAPPSRRRVLVSAIEHHAVIRAADALAKEGWQVQRIPVDNSGVVHPETLASMMADDVALVSVMHANNEVGTIQDVPHLVRIAHQHGAIFHTDAVQTLGAQPIQVRGMGCDLLTVSAHKIYGPKGIGALYVRAGTQVQPILFGGAQEREKRPGTENVAGIVGFGRAISIAEGLRESASARLIAMRDGFIRSLCQIEGVRLNGPASNRLPGNVNISIDGVDGAAVLVNLDRAGIAASSGSACSSGSLEPSHVLLAMGLPHELASSGIRFTLGRGTTDTELATTTATLRKIVARLRSGVTAPQ